MRLAIVVGLLTVLSWPAQAESVTVHTDGEGLTRELAISKALISAVEQATGLTVSTQQLSAMASVSGVENGTAQVSVVQATQELIARSTNGRVLSYQVETVGDAPEGGLLASVSVQVEVFHPKGVINANRRRIASALFEVKHDRDGMGAALQEKLLESLTQTRRFTVVDRSNDQAYESEMELITGPNANPAERARASQVIGADYIVTGHLAIQSARTVGQAAQINSTVLEINGEVVTDQTPSTLRTLPGSLSADFKVIEIATRQIKLAAHVDLLGQDIGALGQAIASRITNTIYPPRLVDISDPQAVVIDQGGSGIIKRQRFRVMQEGRELLDPYSGESLGKKEVQIATIEISDVSDKVSYGQVVSGSLSGVATDLVLRPLDTDVLSSGVRPAAVPARNRAVTRDAPVSPVPGQPGTGFRLPFDH